NFYIKSIFVFTLIMSLFSCKTTTEPVVYNKDTDVIALETQIIYQLIKDGQFQQAHLQIEKNLKLFPEDPDILLYLAWLYLKEEKYQESEELFSQLLLKNRRNPLALSGLARINRIKGNKEKALEYINTGIGMKANYSILWFEKAMLEYEMKEYKSAIIHFNKAYNLDRSLTDAYFFKYLCYLQMNYPIDEVKHHWDRILEKGKTPAWYYLYHSHILYEKGFQQNSRQLLETGLKKYPEDCYLLNFQVYLLVQSYEEDQNQEDLNLALEKMTLCLKEVTHPAILDTYFSVLYHLKEFEQLNLALEQYINQFPDSEILIEWLEKMKLKRE
ncbi:MAG: tetratricopeptide repeat protein, partial [Spirochaetes bacterium]|nr:tetratricopeptide repeat protein [Spirochaetota bacterium]